jgi:O-antigen/teichoic acid export membrane protein
MGLGGIGAALGFVVLSILQVIGAITVWIITHGRTKLGFSPRVMKDVTISSMPSWIPNLLSVLSQWGGVFAVFGYRGSLETGLYYVAFAISGLVNSLSQTALALMFPVLSGMEDGRKRAIWKAIKLAFAATSPLSLLLVLYPYVPLSLLGQSYVEASDQLRLLALSAPFLAIYMGVWSLTYAYGSYRRVLAIGLGNNVPTVMLYIWLVPQMGGLGAAIAFLSGSLIGALFAMFHSHLIGLTIDFKILSIAFLVPSLFSWLLYISHLHWLPGALLLLAVTSVAYARLGIVSRDESTQLATAIIPKPLAKRLRPYLLTFRLILYGH